MDFWFLFTLALLHHVTANEDWTCNFESSTCGMIDEEGGGCWNRTQWPSDNNVFYVGRNCWRGRHEDTAQTTIPRDFYSGRWQLSFTYSAKRNGLLGVVSNCDGSVPLTLGIIGEESMRAKLDFICFSDFKISFIAMRQKRNTSPYVEIDDISVRRHSLTPSTDISPASHTITTNAAFHPDHTHSHHANTFPTFEASTTPSTSHKLPVTPAESNTDYQRSSGEVSSSVSMTSISVTPSTDISPASHTRTTNAAFQPDHTQSNHTNTFPISEDTSIKTPSASRKLLVTPAESSTDRQRSLGGVASSVSMTSVSATPSPDIPPVSRTTTTNAAFYPDHTHLHHANAFPTSEASTTPSTSRKILITPGESNTDYQRSSGEVASSVSMTSISVTPSTDISPASHTSTANAAFHPDHTQSHHTSTFPISEDTIKTPSTSHKPTVTPVKSNTDYQRSSGGVASSVSMTSVSVPPSTSISPASHTSAVDTAFHPYPTHSHHTNTFPTSEVITTPSASRKILVSPFESNTDYQRSSGGVSSSISMTPSALQCAGDDSVIVAMVSIVAVIVLVVMVAAGLFYRFEIWRKSQNSNPAQQLESSGSIHGNPSFSDGELHEDSGLGGDVYVSQDVILQRKAAQSDSLNDACARGAGDDVACGTTDNGSVMSLYKLNDDSILERKAAQGESRNDAFACNAADDVAYGTFDIGNMMPLCKMNDDIKTVATLHSEKEYCSLVRALNARAKHHDQGKVGKNQRGNGPRDTGDQYQTLAQTNRPDVKTHVKTPGSDRISKTARSYGNDDGSATEHPLYLNLGAEQARGDKSFVEDLFDDNYYDVLRIGTPVGNAHHMGELRHHGDDDLSYANTNYYYSSVMSDIGRLQNSVPTRHEPLWSSDVYGELA